MRKIIVIMLPVLMVIFLLTNCSRFTYNYPRGLSDAKLKELKGRVHSGKKMFKTYCAKCHGIFGKGVDSVTNFNKSQIEAYTTNFLHGDYKNHAFTQNLTKTQLTDILMFAYLVERKTKKK